MITFKKKPAGAVPSGKAKMRRPEQVIQIGIFNHLIPLMAAQKHSEFTAFHVPNGGHRSEAEAAIFKAMGVMSGVADICILIPKKYFPAREDVKLTLGYSVTVPAATMPPKTIWIELKVKKTEPPPRYTKDGRLMKKRARKSTAQSDNQKFFAQILEAYGFEYHLLECADPSDGLNKVLDILRDNGVKVR